MMAGPRRTGFVIALLVAAAALLLSCTPVVEARKATGGVHKTVAPKLKDASHASRKFKAHKDAKSGRTGVCGKGWHAAFGHRQLLPLAVVVSGPPTTRVRLCSCSRVNGQWC
jgi:hypothetical protein